ncbi:MAG: hypothetical protein EHM39_05090, partial [Chloroflexi bacterium]
MAVWQFTFQPENQPFVKEPNTSGRRVTRGSLLCGGAEDQRIPLLWDYGQGKLYLDLNRNRDLTDDPEGALSVPKAFHSSQVFTNIHVQFQTPKGPFTMLADLRLYN